MCLKVVALTLNVVMEKVNMSMYLVRYAEAERQSFFTLPTEIKQERKQSMLGTGDQNNDKRIYLLLFGRGNRVSAWVECTETV